MQKMCAPRSISFSPQAGQTSGRTIGVSPSSLSPTCPIISGIIAAHHIAQEIPRKAALAGINQGETRVQFRLGVLRQSDMADVQLLLNARGRGDELQSRRHAANLILPASAGGHNLLDAHGMLIQIVLCVRHAEILEKRFDARACISFLPIL